MEFGSISIWSSTFKIPQFEELRDNIETDVCVIGAGITGLTTAYLLTSNNKKVVVIDDNEIGGGETCRTTAHITNVIDNRYSRIEQLHGEEASRIAAQSQTAAINKIEEIIFSNVIDCDFSRVDGYLFFSPDDRADILEKEFDAAKRAGIDVRLVAKAPLNGFNTYPCLRFPHQAEFHPLKYISALAGLIVKNGGRIYTKTHAQKIEDGNPAIVQTKNKYNITAKDIVVATNSPISDYVKVHTKQIACRTYVIGVEIPNNTVKQALYWDNEDPYHYIRIYKQLKNDILIVGGEDHKTGHDDDAEERYARLFKWTRERFPMAGRIDYKWSGQVMEPFDGLSFTGKDPENKEHVYIATGDSGMGMTHATYSAILLTDMISGKENEWAKLYDPKRITLKAALKFVKEGLDTALQYIDIITPPEAASEGEISPGSGAIMSIGLGKTAVYKDENGKVYKFSALCPHLKCVIEWNASEKTWDCPCHGSRFGAMGNVINGPALGNLKKVKLAHSKALD
ncbi:MAG TPA: FAD-dependent oxidoreductase [Ignavibacteria bacterium]